MRLSLDVSPELYKLLEDTANEIGASKSDVLRKAIVLMNVVVESQAEGKIFGVANNDREPIRKQIVGLF
ncbi:DNA-binding protein [filamentous cyanobacterium CCP5]|nr:DNA-binding protein [filamentous cyanobacterium CCP5]